MSIDIFEAGDQFLKISHSCLWVKYLLVYGLRNAVKLAYGNVNRVIDKINHSAMKSEGREL